MLTNFPIENIEWKYKDFTIYKGCGVDKYSVSFDKCSFGLSIRLTVFGQLIHENDFDEDAFYFD